MSFSGVGGGLAVARALSLGCGFMSSSVRGAAAAAAACSASSSPSSALPLPVYFDHDGGSDDFVAMLYLLKHEQRRAVGVGAMVQEISDWFPHRSARRRACVSMSIPVCVCLL